MHWGEAHWLSASNQREYLRGAGESFRNFDLPACSPLPRPWWFSHRVFSYLRMEVSVPDLQHSRRWMETLGDREQSQGTVALAFGARSPTSRLQSKCIKPAVCAKFSPGFYLVWPIQVLISFNYLKTFKNLENLSKHLTFWLVLKILASFNTPLPGNHWLEMRAAVLWQDLRSPLCHNPHRPLLPHFTHTCSLFGRNPPIFLVSPWLGKIEDPREFEKDFGPL